MADPLPHTLELKTYNGNCHCGAFKFTVKLPELTTVTECDCSVCSKKGYKWIFVNKAMYTIERGEDSLKAYQYGHHLTAHEFCPTCGTGVQGRLPDTKMVAINVRTFMDVDLWSLKVEKLNNLASEPSYVQPPFTGSIPDTAIEGSKLYTGGCHCGAVKLALQAQGPFPSGLESIQECDCSICARNGWILTYPSCTQVSISGSEHLKPYSFGRKFQAHEFCSLCGVAVYIKRLAPPQEIYDSWSADRRARWWDMLPLNIRCLGGVEWEAVKVEKGDWSQVGARYVCPEPGMGKAEGA